MTEKNSRLLRRREALTIAGLGLTGALGARASGVLGSNGRKGYRGSITLGVAT